MACAEAIWPTFGYRSSVNNPSSLSSSISVPNFGALFSSSRKYYSFVECRPNNFVGYTAGAMRRAGMECNTLLGLEKKKQTCCCSNKIVA